MTDGTLGTSDIDIPDGYTAIAGAATVFGDPTDSFLIKLSRDVVNEDGETLTLLSIGQVEVDEAGAASLLDVTDIIDPLDDPFDTVNGSDARIILQPLGDGRVAYSIAGESNNQDGGKRVGVLEETDTGIKATVLLDEFPGEVPDYKVLAIPDAGTVVLLDLDRGDEDPAVEVVQFDVDGDVLESEVFTFAGTGEDPLDPGRVPVLLGFLVTDEGELVVFPVDLANAAPTVLGVFDLLPAQIEDPEPVGVPTEGDDIIYGNSGDDSLFGADDDDRIYGGTGDDYIKGGVDADALKGGAGADTFAYDAGDGSDVIKDFGNGADVIDLTSMELEFGDIFLSQDESAAIIEAGDVTIRLENTNVDDIEEASFLL